MKYNSDIISSLNTNNESIKLMNLIADKSITWQSKIYKENNIFNLIIYKKIFCVNSFNKVKCKKGNKCFMIHTKDKFNYPKIHNLNDFIVYYKTIPCPLIKFNHLYSNCFYSHGFLDYRRIYSNYLEPIYCDNYKNFKNNNKENSNLTSKKICWDYSKCNKLHSKQEYLYHFKIFKRNLCKINNIHNKVICPYYHDNIDKNNVNDNLIYANKNKTAFN